MAEQALRVVVAPDSFKGSAAAADAAAALMRGWLEARPGDRVSCVPMADGGEGTIDALAAAGIGAERVPVRVLGPDDRETESSWLRLPDGSAVVELAATSGLLLLPVDGRGDRRLLPRRAHTFGVGQAIRAAIEAGAPRVHVALGGSSSSDGGAGLLTALGARLLDADGRAVPLGNIGLERLERVELDELIELPAAGLVVWTDVRSPLLGPEGAVAVFGAQKGLAGEEADRAERALARFAERIGGDPSTPGAGAAGGAGFGLQRLGAEVVSGAEAVAEAAGLDAALVESDVLITGEGSFDDQSAQGKVVSLLVELARARGVSTMLVAGRIAAPTDAFESALALAVLAEHGEDPMRDAVALLERAGRALAADRSGRSAAA